MKHYRVFHFDGEPDNITGRLVSFDIDAHEATFVTAGGLMVFDNVSDVQVTK